MGLPGGSIPSGLGEYHGERSFLDRIVALYFIFGDFLPSDSPKPSGTSSFADYLERWDPSLGKLYKRIQLVHEEVSNLLRDGMEASDPDITAKCAQRERLWQELRQYLECQYKIVQDAAASSSTVPKSRSFSYVQDVWKTQDSAAS